MIHGVPASGERVAAGGVGCASGARTGGRGGPLIPQATPASTANNRMKRRGPGISRD
ncbi:Hypothetical protein AA314_08594 [Archangium gephyra]|uniref:Uncharacterized protein n=1 Tax=Archangium gephyra TaxID=48 RepID=A0AAC8QGB8_9BACT|nr:Hypothetical protein AA314_08594 [Archangium gephyra]